MSSIDHREPKYTIGQTAEILCISRHSVWRARKEGRLGSYLLRGKRLIGAHHIEEYLKASETKASRRRGVEVRA